MLSTRQQHAGEGSDFLHADFDQKHLFLKQIRADFVKTGFLMVFCEAQYCTENIRFVVAVSKYQNLFANDGLSWQSWRTVDNTPADTRKPQPICEDRLREIQKDIKFINESFLMPSAKLEICLPHDINQRTIRRMDEYKTYGPEVFEEACIDPENTLIKDILPRFVVSNSYQDMQYFMTKMLRLPPAKTMRVFPPELSYGNLIDVLDKLKDDDAIRKYIGDDIKVYLEDPLLYGELLRYLTKIVSSENLLCIRAIDMFVMFYDDYIASGCKDQVLSTIECAEIFEAEEMSRKENRKGPVIPKTLQLKTRVVAQAWSIFLHCITPDSSLEVGLSHALVNSVSRNMAAPNRDMFTKVRASALIVLEHKFQEFKQSPGFEKLFELCKERQGNRAQIEAEHRMATKSAGWLC